MTLDELLLEWSYRLKGGYPDMDSPSDIQLLREILIENKMPADDIIDELEGLEKGEEEEEESGENNKTPPPTKNSDKLITIKDIINILPDIEEDQEALLKMKKYITNRKGEIGFFNKIVLKNINDATIDSSNAPKDLYQILSDNNDVENYDVFDQPSFSELGKEGNIFSFYEKNSDLSRKTILSIFNYFGTEGGRGVGKGEMGFALLFKDIEMATGKGDLSWSGSDLEVKGTAARLGDRDRIFGGFERTKLGQLSQKYNKTDKNLVSLIGSLANEEEIILDELLIAVIEFEDEAHPLGNASKYFTLEILTDPKNRATNTTTSLLRKAFAKNYIKNYASKEGVDNFIWWNSNIYGSSSATPGEAKTKWGTYIIFTPGEADSFVDSGKLMTNPPSVGDLDPSTMRP